MEEEAEKLKKMTTEVEDAQPSGASANSEDVHLFCSKPSKSHQISIIFSKLDQFSFN